MEVLGPRARARTVLGSREVDLMIRRTYLALDDTWAQRFARYADLQQPFDLETVALFLGPPDLEPAPAASGTVNPETRRTP